MRVETLTVGPLETNCYLVICQETLQAMVVDPGAESGRIAGVLRAHMLDLKWIVCTHGHGDHVGANTELKRAFPKATLATHELDAPMLPSVAKNLSFLANLRITSCPPDAMLKDGESIEFGKLRFVVIHTPGHTAGGICLYRASTTPREKPVLFSGDTLFAGSVGRCDLPGGSEPALLRSIRERFLALPDDCVVWPGHGPATTIGSEKAENPFLK
jgi:hydroxyacylglutathione hydrolase